MKSLQKILVILCLLCGIAACGRYSLPEPVEGSGYPHNYPNNPE